MATETLPRDLRSSLVDTDGNGASRNRRTSRETCVVFSGTVRAPKLDVRKNRPRIVRSDRTTKHETSVGYTRCSDQQTSSARHLYGRIINMMIVTTKWTLWWRHAFAERPVVETLETFLTLSVVTTTITFVDVDVNNAVTWTLNGSSDCEVNKKFCFSNLEYSCRCHFVCLS